VTPRSGRGGELWVVCEGVLEHHGGDVGGVCEGSLEDGARARCDGPGHLSEGPSAGFPTTPPEISENVSTSSRMTPPSGLPVPLDESPHDPSKRSATTSTRSATGLPEALHTTTNPRVQRLPTGSLRDPRETPRRPPPTPSQEPSQITSTRSPRALPRPSPRAPRDTRRAPPHPSQRPQRRLGGAIRRALPPPLAGVSERRRPTLRRLLWGPSETARRSIRRPLARSLRRRLRDPSTELPEALHEPRDKTPARSCTGSTTARRDTTRDAVNDAAPPSR
jgi:hypothetical protein